MRTKRIRIGNGKRVAQLTVGLTDVEVLTVRFLYGTGDDLSPRMSDIGWAVWGDVTTHPKRGEGAHNQNKFCRVAGRVIRGLIAKEIVETQWHTHTITYKLTEHGKSIAATLPQLEQTDRKAASV